MAKNVEADEVDGAEGGRLGPADGCSGERVDVFDGEIHLLHQAHDVEHGKRPNAITDEVGRVFGEDDALAEAHVAEPGDGVEQCAVAIGGGDEFQKTHVARGVEEMRTKPGAAEIVGKASEDESVEPVP